MTLTLDGIPPTTLSLTPALSITEGGTGTLTAALGNAQTYGTTITVTSSNPLVATVPAASITIPAGSTTAIVVVTGVAVGTATVTAKLPLVLGGASASSVVTVSFPAYAPATWAGGGGPPGGVGNAITVDPANPSVLYAGYRGGTVFRSTNSGSTWGAWGSPGTSLWQLVSDPQQPSTLYARIDAGSALARSTDSGRTWATVQPLGGWFDRFKVFALSPSSPGVLYAASGHHTGYRSTDAGSTWTLLSAPFPDYTTALVVSPASPATLLAADPYGGLKRSTDSGATWTDASGLPSSSNGVTRIVFSRADPVTAYAVVQGNQGRFFVYRSTDTGVTWTSRLDTPSSSLRQAPPLLDCSGSAVFFAYDGLYKSTDAGTTWAKRNWSTDFLTMAPSLSNLSVLYLGTTDGVFLSTDAGETWSPLTSRPAARDPFSFAFDPANPLTLYAATADGDAGILKSTDGGGSWIRTIIDSLRPGYPAASLVIDPANPSTLFAADDIAVYRSTDGAATWREVFRDGDATFANTLALAPTVPPTVYAGTWTKGLWRSTDGGSTWTSANYGLPYPMLTIVALAVDQSQPTTVYTAANGYNQTNGIHKSTDSGATWAEANNGLSGTGALAGHALAVDPSNSSNVYAGTEAGFFRSTDAGGTWTKANTGLGTGTVTAIAVNPSAPSVIYAGTSLSGTGGTALDAPRGLFRSTDSGKTWAAANEGLPWLDRTMPGVNTLAFDSRRDTTLWAGLSFGGLWQMRSNSRRVPVVISTGGLKDSFFTSEMAITNRGESDVLVSYAYTQAFGGSSGSASEILKAGVQKIVPDAIEYLRGLGIPVGDSGGRGGSLRVELSGPGAVTVRTLTAVPGGRAGLAYPAVSSSNVLSDPVYLCGLRQNDTDRSNVAIIHGGTAADGPITLRLTVFSGDPAHPQTTVLPDIGLAPGGFNQVAGVLESNGLSLTNGYVKVERVSGTAPFLAYGVINDQANSDGSYVQPVPASPPSAVARLTLPVIVETGAFSSELVVTNFTPSPRTLQGKWVASALTGGEVHFGLSLLPNEQQIVPAFVQVLRDRGVVKDAAGPGFAGAVFFTDDTGDLRGVSVGARTSTPGGSGRYGLFYSAVPAGEEATATAWLYDLQQNAENRTNLALVNVGSVDSSADTFRIQIYDGATGQIAGTADGVSVPAKGFVQLNAILAEYAPTVTSGYAAVTRTSGSNPFIAYAVVNDGANPGQRSGDGAFVEAEVVQGR